jgi:hypothetical protein
MGNVTSEEAESNNNNNGNISGDNKICPRQEHQFRNRQSIRFVQDRERAKMAEEANQLDRLLQLGGREPLVLSSPAAPVHLSSWNANQVRLSLSLNLCFYIMTLQRSSFLGAVVVVVVAKM